MLEGIGSTSSLTKMIEAGPVDNVDVCRWYMNMNRWSGGYGDGVVVVMDMEIMEGCGDERVGVQR